MTERKEIERLLQMTGRTLEDLPKAYPLDKCIATGRRKDVMPEELGSFILHQSDVIEQLISALRDALEEREAVLADLKGLRVCILCAHWETGIDEPCMHCTFENNCFEWRGQKEEEHETT